MHKKCAICSKETLLLYEEMFDDRYGCQIACSLYECSECGHISTNPNLVQSELPRLYEQFYSRKKTNLEELTREFHESITSISILRRWLKGLNHLGHYKAKINDVVLDFGSGSCGSLLDLKKIGAIPYGLEADPAVKEIADHFGLKVFVGKLCDSPYASMKFDLITLNQVLEHIPDPAQTLLEIKKIISSDGGRVILSFPNAKSIYRFMFGRDWINWHVPFHQHHFNKKSFQILANNCGYRLVWCQTVTPNTWTEVQIQNFFNKRFKYLSNDTWQSDASMPPVSKTFFKQVFSRATWSTISLAVTLVNRLIDLSGCGDSVVCEIQPMQVSANLN